MLASHKVSSTVGNCTLPSISSPISTTYTCNALNLNSSTSTIPTAIKAVPIQKNSSSTTEKMIYFNGSDSTVGGVAPSRIQVARESVAFFAEILSMDAATMTANNQHMTEDMVCMGLFEFMLKLCSIFSMISVCLHTPYTINVFPLLEYTLFFVDLFVTLFFTVEAFMKTNRQSIQNRWFQFDLTLLFFHYLSVLLHLYELIAKFCTKLGLSYNNWYGIVRSPRPFIMIRLIRSVLRFKLPKNRIEQIIKRSSQQIQNVSIFFMFFMALYAIMGVQLFGRMEYHCVVPGTNPKNVTINDLAIPDTKCGKNGGYECPSNMECMKLALTAKQKGIYGMFDDFSKSLFTVYLAASEEGWVYVFYECMDAMPSFIAFIYFVTLIFFLAWLVKNVFIAVITETFAEIRVQFSEMWQTRELLNEANVRQMKLEKHADDKWILIAVNSKNENKSSSKLWHNFVRTTSFQISIMALVLMNALINASFVYRHDNTDIKRKKIYYFIEVAFTVLFNLEFFLKVISLTWSGYIRRGQHKFELILCGGSTLNIMPFFYNLNIFTYFQVFRILRLIKASPMLEDFVYKIFGPGKKLGGLVFFTMILLIITSAISLQLFCHVHELEKFRTFPQAFMSMFQIITQEGWTDEVVEILRAISDPMVPFVAIYFVCYHLFVTLILLSLFVAVILDNLEMDEELKKIKQLKAREETTCMRTMLPWRLRVFEKFPTCPQMVKLRKVNSDFPMPKVRDSFTRQFFDSEFVNIGGVGIGCGSGDTSFTAKRLLNCHTFLHLSQKAYFCCKKSLYTLRMRQIGQLSSKFTVNCLVEESNKNRMLLSDSTQLIAQRVNGLYVLFGNSKSHKPISRHRSLTFSSKNSIKVRAIYKNFKENNEMCCVGSHVSDSAQKKEIKNEIDIKALQQKRAHAEFTRNRIEEEMRENHPLFDRPLFAVGRNSRLRHICHQIVDAKYLVTGRGIDPLSGRKIVYKYKQIYALFGLLTYLDWGMVLVTGCSCVSMLFESPWPTTTYEYLVFNNLYLQIFEYIFVLAMTFELTVKILANGLFFTPKAVVGDVGGVMTLFIYITSVWYLLCMPRHVEINSLAQFVMIFRAMRPLRIYTLVPHIQRVVVELCKGFKDILLVTILLVLLMFVFASFGVQIAGGQLAGCNDSTIKNRENCTSVFEQKVFVTRMEVYGKNNDKVHPKIIVPRVWTNPRNFNFDHIGNAMLALFETLSYKGWNVIRDILMDRKGLWAAVFIHVYVFIGCMIGVTLFIGVVVANYLENSGTALLTVDQRRWNDLKSRLRMAQPLHVPPKPSESAKIRNRLYVLTTSRLFKQFYAFLVVVNSGALVVPWNVEEELNRKSFLNCLTLLSALCTVLFAVEIVLKIVAFTFRGFWESKRNRIDLLITVLSVFWIAIHFIIALPIASVIVSAPTRFKRFTYTFGYMVVIMRFFTIAGRKSTLKILMLTVLMGMVRSFFIITAMFLLILFYAYAGVILFGMVKYGQAVSKHVNFRSGKEALVVLFRSVTGEDWNDIMHDCMRSPPFCYWKEGMNYFETDCGNYFGAIIYFCSFYLIIVYIVLNLLVAIIMENFSLFYSSEEDALLSYADIRNYQQVWNLIDKEQKHTIPTNRVKFLLRLLKGRLEVDPNKDRLLFKHMCYEMERLNNGDDVSFHDILSMLSYRSVDIRKSLQLEELLPREELEFAIEEEVAKQTIRSWLQSCLRRIKQHQSTPSAAIEIHSKISLLSLNFNLSLSGEVLLNKTNSTTPVTKNIALPFFKSFSFTNSAQSLLTSKLNQAAIAANVTTTEKLNLATKLMNSLRRNSIPEFAGNYRMKSLPTRSDLPDRLNPIRIAAKGRSSVGAFMFHYNKQHSLTIENSCQRSRTFLLFSAAAAALSLTSKSKKHSKQLQFNNTHDVPDVEEREEITHNRSESVLPKNEADTKDYEREEFNDQQNFLETSIIDKIHKAPQYSVGDELYSNKKFSRNYADNCVINKTNFLTKYKLMASGVVTSVNDVHKWWNELSSIKEC